MRPIARLLCALALLATLSVRAEIRGTLHEPRDGAVLQGGSTATVSWSAAELPRFAEEWEEFLSVDGGGYYGYRITPHMDLDRRRFTFEVPNVETDRARILIRTGDERQEVEIELDATFAIRQDRAEALAAERLQVLEAARGEAARPGDLGVVVWIDGDRRGHHLVARSALRHLPTLGEAPLVTVFFETAEDAASSDDAGPRAAVSRFLRTTAFHTARLAQARSRAGRDVLLTYRRLNI